MKVLVTGAAGFLGSHLTRLLLQENIHHVRCFVRQESSKQKLLDFIGNELMDRVEIVIGNITSHNDVVQAIQDIEVIYHCAAVMKGATADMIYNTVVGSKILLEAILENNIKRLVLVSSFSVYGVASLPKYSTIDESTPYEAHPVKRDAYAYTKCKQEKLCREYSEKHGIPLVIVRPGVIYGEGSSPFSSRVGLNLFGIFLHLGHDNSIPLTHVTNCAKAIALAGEVAGVDGQIFNIHDDELVTSAQYLKLYKNSVKRLKSVGIPYRLLYFLAFLNEKYFIYSKGQLPEIFSRYKVRSQWKQHNFSNAKAKKELNWAPMISIPDGLNAFFRYLKHRDRNK
jgi:nucleoside-diphosphate-sugar epimerase